MLATSFASFVGRPILLRSIGERCRSEDELQPRDDGEPALVGDTVGFKLGDPPRATQAA